ncbi:hypothetical protein, partial [Pseudomonas syringae]|uniref:hypothetical protein n=1 Tax=Pseudomonas syringae TaxID=317 RepID=UPI001F396323
MDKAVIDLLKRRVIDGGKQSHGADSARTAHFRREVDGLAAAVRAARSSLSLRPDSYGSGVFQGSCRVSRLTMPLFSQPVALDPDSTTRCRSAPSYAFDPTTVPAFSLWLVRTA